MLIGAPKHQGQGHGRGQGTGFPRTQDSDRVCVSLFYVHNISSTGPRGRTLEVPMYTYRPNSDAQTLALPFYS